MWRYSIKLSISLPAGSAPDIPMAEARGETARSGNKNTCVFSSKSLFEKVRQQPIGEPSNGS